MSDTFKWIFDGIGSSIVPVVVGSIASHLTGSMARDSGVRRTANMVFNIGLWMFCLCLTALMVVSTYYGIQEIRSLTSNGAQPAAPVTPGPATSASDGPKPRFTTAERVTAIIAQQLNIDRKNIKPSDDFEMDLGASPTQVYLICSDLETEYNITISGDDRKNLHTVGETITYIQHRIGKH